MFIYMRSYCTCSTIFCFSNHLCLSSRCYPWMDTTLPRAVRERRRERALSLCIIHCLCLLSCNCSKLKLKVYCVVLLACKHAAAAYDSTQHAHTCMRILGNFVLEPVIGVCVLMLYSYGNSSTSIVDCIPVVYECIQAFEILGKVHSNCMSLWKVHVFLRVCVYIHCCAKMQFVRM